MSIETSEKTNGLLKEYQNLYGLIRDLWHYKPCVLVLDLDYVLIEPLRERKISPGLLYLLKDLRDNSNIDIFVATNRPNINTGYSKHLKAPRELYDTFGEERVFASNSLFKNRLKSSEAGINRIAKSISKSPVLEGGILSVDDRRYRGEPFLKMLERGIALITGQKIDAKFIKLPDPPLSNTFVGRIFP